MKFYKTYICIYVYVYIWVRKYLSRDLPQERGGEEAVLCGWRGLVSCDAPHGWQIFSNWRWTPSMGKEWMYWNVSWFLKWAHCCFHLYPASWSFETKLALKLTGVGNPSVSLLAAGVASLREGWQRVFGWDRPHMHRQVTRTRIDRGGNPCCGSMAASQMGVTQNHVPPCATPQKNWLASNHRWTHKLEEHRVHRFFSQTYRSWPLPWSSGPERPENLPEPKVQMKKQSWYSSAGEVMTIWCSGGKGFGARNIHILQWNGEKLTTGPYNINVLDLEGLFSWEQHCWDWDSIKVAPRSKRVTVTKKWEFILQ